MPKYSDVDDRSGIVDPALTEKWESILLLAEKFGMKQAAKVACYALGRAGVLSDVHKIALCVKHGLGKDWVVEDNGGCAAKEPW